MKTYEIHTQQFILKNDIKLNIELIENKDNVRVYKLNLHTDDGYLNNIEITMPFEMKGILSTYAPTSVFKRNRMVMQWFAPITSESNFYYGTPFLSAVDKGQYNYITVALSDAENDNAISFCVQDFKQEEKVEYIIKLLTGRQKFADYSVYLRVDTKTDLMSNTIKNLTEWFSLYYPQNDNVPSSCFAPLYSSWYNFHQHPNAEKLYDELKYAKEVGLDTLIIDDGWQYDGNGTADYIDCGDWSFSKEKFPDFKGFVEYVHKLGIKVMLWFPLPFVGFNTNAYQKFKDKLLYEEGSTTNAGVLDPRYKEVREHIIDVLLKFMKEYSLDGFKLDFIDSFTMKDDSPTFNSQMDEEQLTVAIQKLLTGINEELYKMNENVMIEFRQNYVGPAIIRHANMLRVMDCAFDSVTNRIAINDMRLLNYKSAIHSDMLYWAKDESNENVATQLINVMFSVPQISVLLSEQNKENLQVVKNYLRYWKENQKLLMFGDFNVDGMDVNYKTAKVSDADKEIVALYANNICSIDNKDVDIFNASASEDIVIINNRGKVNYSVYDCLGNLMKTDELNDQINRIKVNIGGRVEIVK